MERPLYLRYNQAPRVIWLNNDLWAHYRRAQTSLRLGKLYQIKHRLRTLVGRFSGLATQVSIATHGTAL